jgi:hypothetical protein
MIRIAHSGRCLGLAWRRPIEAEKTRNRSLDETAETMLGSLHDERLLPADQMETEQVDGSFRGAAFSDVGVAKVLDLFHQQ